MWNKNKEIMASPMRKPTTRVPVPPSAFKPADFQPFVEELFIDDLRAKCVRSLADVTRGALQAGALGIHAIGRGLAAARGLLTKHAVKQVDRRVGNSGVSVWELFA